MEDRMITSLVVVGTLLVGGFLIALKTKKKVQTSQNGNQQTGTQQTGTVAVNQGAAVTQMPATPAPAPSMVTKVKEFVGKKEFQAGLGVGVAIGLVFLLIFKANSLSSLAPYSLVLIAGAFVYHFGNMGTIGNKSKNWGYVVWTVGFTIVLITLLLHPHVFGNILAPFQQSGTGFFKAISTSFKEYVGIVWAIIVVQCLVYFFVLGKPVEAFTTLIFLTVFTSFVYAV